MSDRATENAGSRPGEGRSSLLREGDPSSADCDDREQSPVAPFSRPPVPAITEEPVGLSGGITLERVDGRDARPGQTASRITREVEQELLARSSKQRFVRRVVPQEGRCERRIDLVARLRDGRPDGSDDPLTPGAESFHAVHGVLQHACQCTPPPGVGGAHDPGHRIRKQDRRTVGSQNADGNVWVPGDDGIRLLRGRWHRAGNEDAGTVNLHGSDQGHGSQARHRKSPTPILGHP